MRSDVSREEKCDVGREEVSSAYVSSPLSVRRHYNPLTRVINHTHVTSNVTSNATSNVTSNVTSNTTLHSMSRSTSDLTSHNMPHRTSLKPSHESSHRLSYNISRSASQTMLQNLSHITSKNSSHIVSHSGSHHYATPHVTVNGSVERSKTEGKRKSVYGVQPGEGVSESVKQCKRSVALTTENNTAISTNKQVC